MDEHRGSFVAVRRISQGLDRSSECHSTSAKIVAGSSAWIGRGLSCVCAQRRESDARLSFDLTPSQEECLHRLQSRIEVAYDSSNLDHQVTRHAITHHLRAISCRLGFTGLGRGYEVVKLLVKESAQRLSKFSFSMKLEALRSLWYAAFPGEELRGLISEQWKEMGWQGKDPSTDFRGGGFISLENLLFFAKNYPKSFQNLLWKQEGDRSMWEYPFAVAGVNITFMLIQMLDLQSENEQAFDLLYCIAFKLMDQQWLDMRASYMDFNTVMKSTRRQLERELLLEDITRLEDMPSYSLLQ